MKLFKNKNRGPKVKSEDVVIPEAYLEYEREAEEKKRLEARAAEKHAEEAEKTAEEATTGEVEAEIDAFKARLDSILNNRPTLDGDEPGEEASSVGSLDEPIEFNIKRPARTKAETVNTPRKETSEAQEAPKIKKKKKTKQKRENPYSPQFMALLAGIVVAVATVVVLLGPVMAIDQVEVNDLQYISDKKVVEMAGNPVGENLFRYRASKAEDALRQYPYIKDVEIHRHFPHRLVINVTEREPAGVLMNNGNYLQFTKDGILLDNTKSLSNQNLPLITGFKMEEVPSPGEAFKDNVRFNDILRIVNACDDDLLRMLQEINIKDRNNILAYTSQGIEIRIGSVENIEVRMATLNDIINQVILSGIIEEPIEAIDIRYEKSPVVVLEGYSNIDVSEYVDKDEKQPIRNEEAQNTQAPSDEGGMGGEDGMSANDMTEEPTANDVPTDATAEAVQ